ncbi:hypothetical protein [Clostridium sp.]|uniref:hypothetical protein n=1 Tax=Clostridium sp. TaxID=1506 RepID=UPI003D6D98D2
MENIKARFLGIIAQARNINSLPTMIDIYKKIEEICESQEGLDEDKEKEVLASNWNGTITIKDGTEIELVEYIGKCILHDFRDYDGEKLYKIDDNLFLCADCLTLCKKQPNLVAQHYDYDYSMDKWVFPKKWDENKIINWIKNQNNNQKEYYERKSYYDDSFDEDFDDDFNDEPKFDNLKDFLNYEKEVQEAEKLKQKQAEEKKALRNAAWNTRECRYFYEKLINCTGSDLTKSKLKSAKDIAISSYLKKIQPDYADFKFKIELAKLRKDRKKEKREKYKLSIHK